MKKYYRTTKYARVHYWLRKTYGTPKLCKGENCLGTSIYFDWALRKGKKHEKNISNYIRLCKKCHIVYDWNDEKTNHMIKISHTKQANDNRAKKLAGRKRPPHIGEGVRKFFSKKVVKINIKGESVTYSSLTEAAKKNSVSLNSVWLIVKGINKGNKHGETYVYLQH